VNAINRPLEAFNGAWAILAGYCVVFLLIHLYMIGITRHLTLRKWLFHLPIGMQLAVATMSICAAIFITRSAIWYWRFFYEGEADALSSQATPLAVGAFLGCWSFLCILRVITHPFGIWPTLMAVGTVVAYLATFLL
jgi:hypothetical protein